MIASDSETADFWKAVNNFEAMIHATATIDRTAKIGKKVKIWANTNILKNVVIEDDVSIGACSEIGIGSHVGSGTRIGFGVFLPAKSIIGKNVFIGPGCTFCDDKNPKAGNVEYHAQPPVIEDGASIGAGATVLPGIRIGKDSLIGAGSVVTKDVQAGTTVRGKDYARVIGA